MGLSKLSINSLPGEEWAQIAWLSDDHRDVFVSDLGRIKSIGKLHYIEGKRCWGTAPSNMYNFLVNKDGYLMVRFYIAKKRRTFAVHRLVAKAFKPCIEGKDVVNHLDGDRQNNRASNLEWCTISENNYHRFKLNPTPYIGEKHPAAKLTESQVREIRTIYASGNMNQYELAARFDLKQGHISSIINKKVWAFVD